MVTTNEILTALNEMAEPHYVTPDAQKYRRFLVNYYAVTPSGSRARFQRGASLAQIQWGRSETAVRGWLQTQHPRCDIQIMRLEWA